MRNRAQQALLDEFFGALSGDGQWQQWVTDRGFAKTRDRLVPEALSWLNRTLIEQVDGADLVHRWHGLRVVAADASVLMPAVRSCHTKRRLAGANQCLFSMVLPGADLTLHASVHGPETSERQMLFEALDQLDPNDLLVLDRGYPAAWLVAVLNERGIRYCMHCDNNSGWAALRAKGINLKDYVFSREFIEKPEAEKRQFLADRAERFYTKHQAGRALGVGTLKTFNDKEPRNERPDYDRIST